MSTHEKFCPTCQRPFDLTRICRDCAATFSISRDEQDKFLKLGLELPKRCSGCRAARRNRNQAPSSATN